MKPVRAFETNSTLVGLQLGGGILLVIVGIILLMRGGPGMPLGIGVLMAIVGMWNMKHEPVRLYQDHMELKFAPATGLKLIRYRDLIRMEGASDKARNLFFRDAGQEKKLQLRLDTINAAERPRLIVMLEQKIRENNSGGNPPELR